MMRERVCVALGLLGYLSLLASVVLLVTTTIEHFRASGSPGPAPSFLTPAAAAMLMYRQPAVGLPAQSSGPEPVKSPRRGAGRYFECPRLYRDNPRAERAVDSARAALAQDIATSAGPPARPDAGDAAETRPGRPDALAPHVGRDPKARRQAEMRETYWQGPPPPGHPENRRYFEWFPHKLRGPDDARRPADCVAEPSASREAPPPTATTRLGSQDHPRP